MTDSRRRRPPGGDLVGVDSCGGLWDKNLPECLADLGPTGQRQRPLTMRIDVSNLGPILREAFGVTPSGAAMIMDLCADERPVSYSLSARAYDVPKRYQRSLYTWRKVRGAADDLDQRGGLIQNAPAAPGKRGWQSAMTATPFLHQEVARLIKPEDIRPARLEEVLWLRERDTTRQLLDYADTDRTRRMRRRTEEQNEAIMGESMPPGVAAPLHRICNGRLSLGGRFYTPGGFQGMSQEERADILIGGEPVVELDYKTIHPALLYHEVGMPCPLDCYAVPGFPRPLAKLALMVMINANTEASARLVIACHDHPTKPKMRLVAKPGSREAMRIAANLIEALKHLHAPIARSFHSDAGIRLMATDSAIADEVMARMRRQGITVLPVHDSFICQSSKAALLEEAMIAAGEMVAGVKLRVERK